MRRFRLHWFLAHVLTTTTEKHADVFLTYWARWARSRIIAGHAYSSESIEYRLMRDGLIVSHSRDIRESTDEVAEYIESIIIRMPPKMKKVIKIEYLVYGPRKLKQEICRLGRRRYEDLLRRGQGWVYHEMEGVEF